MRIGMNGTFQNLVEALGKWTDRNTKVAHSSSDIVQKRENLY